MLKISQSATVALLIALCFYRMVTKIKTDVMVMAGLIPKGWECGVSFQSGNLDVKLNKRIRELCIRKAILT